MLKQKIEGKGWVVVVIASSLEYYAQAYLSRVLSNRYDSSELASLFSSVTCSCVFGGKNLWIVSIRLGRAGRQNGILYPPSQEPFPNERRHILFRTVRV